MEIRDEAIQKVVDSLISLTNRECIGLAEMGCGLGVYIKNIIKDYSKECGDSYAHAAVLFLLTLNKQVLADIDINFEDAEKILTEH